MSTTVARAETTGHPPPRVTIVTPFYNSAAWLARAIESVLAQTHGNFEYILADNCSTDNSLTIAASYAARDPRIRVYTHTEFLDQDANYNRALGYMSPDSRYCKIVQADDWLYPRCVEETVALAEAHPRVGIVASCFLMGDTLAGQGLPFDQDVFSGREACRTRLLRGGTYFGSPTCLLYRAEVVRERTPFFRPDETNADTTACFEILEHWDFGRVPQILCGLRVAHDSVSKSLQRLGASALFNYALVVRYGGIYLRPDEVAARRRTLRKIYIKALARNVLRGAPASYWQFHEEQLRRLGEELPRREIAFRLLDYLADKLLNPRRSLELLADWLRESRSPSGER